MKQKTRIKILRCLKSVPKQSLWGFTISSYLVDFLFDNSLVELLSELQHQIKDSPDNMKKCLGSTYKFIACFDLRKYQNII